MPKRMIGREKSPSVSISRNTYSSGSWSPAVPRTEGWDFLCLHPIKFIISVELPLLRHLRTSWVYDRNFGCCIRSGNVRNPFDFSRVWILGPIPVSYTHLRAHETDSYLVCRLLLE